MPYEYSFLATSTTCHSASAASPHCYIFYVPFAILPFFTLILFFFSSPWSVCLFSALCRLYRPWLTNETSDSSFLLVVCFLSLPLLVFLPFPSYFGLLVTPLRLPISLTYHGRADRTNKQQPYPRDSAFALSVVSCFFLVFSFIFSFLSFFCSLFVFFFFFFFECMCESTMHGYAPRVIRLQVMQDDAPQLVI